MEKTICFVVGLPGSGKSNYLEQLQKSGFLAINNPADVDKDVLPFLTGEGQIFAIADYNLCFPTYREKMVVKIRSAIPEAVFRWVYFENDPIQSLSNLRAAGIRVGEVTRENFVWQVSQGYSIPANIETKPVVRLDNQSNTSWPSYAPSNKVESTFKLIRVMDDLVIFASANWDSFRTTSTFILQKFPGHRYMIVEEVLTRNVKEVLFDRLIS